MRRRLGWRDATSHPAVMVTAIAGHCSASIKSIMAAGDLGLVHRHRPLAQTPPEHAKSRIAYGRQPAGNTNISYALGTHAVVLLDENDDALHVGMRRDSDPTPSKTATEVFSGLSSYLDSLLNALKSLSMPNQEKSKRPARRSMRRPILTRLL